MLKVKPDLGTVDEALHFLYIVYCNWCKEHRTSPTPHMFSKTMLGMSRAVARSYPILGSEVKAAHCKVMVYFLAYAATDLDAGTPHARLVTCCATALADCLHCFDSCRMWLPLHLANRSCDSGNFFVECYVALAQEALGHGSCLWKIRPKLHDFQEILVRVAIDHFNPLYYQCINDEHMLGVFKKTTKACHKATAAYSTAMRYLAELSRIWEGRRH